MPTKKSKPSAFMMFVNQWRDKSANDLSLNDAIAEAGIVWANMNLNERTPFVQCAIVEKRKLQKQKKSYANDE
uniref:HMG box domain-containing protein n=1 Tax=Glossina palpalis gambiensis TaxID=67801 RepID=A0A1B0AZC8_9MUSC